MTETREVTKDVYRRIKDQAHDLFVLIDAAMNDSTECGDEWHELHDWMRLASVINGAAGRAAAVAPAPAASLPLGAPVPYCPCNDLQCPGRDYTPAWDGS